MITKLLISCICYLIITVNAYAYTVDGLRIHNPDLFKYINENMPHTGTLKTNNAGYIYLEVADGYIFEVLKHLKDSNYTVHRGVTYLGAHISVMYEAEAKGKNITELGQEFKFKPVGFYSVVMEDCEFLMLAVDAPKLSKLRLKYGLSARLNNYSFHITIAVKNFAETTQDDAEMKL